ncbi:hypothetical protein Sme01_62820 [Sphaerisporangium melleum]|uniref:REase associating with pPIWI RE domain-containing protein n=1 Tax=Sphaerisporangium melleum TaxID=321316 RepID=A0A917R0Q2_9ACTN|nr:hypothetical protein [Sphaerisporangium melleum]GGK81772.1 hypothetical protein GCM10007964_25530 [Sphaerisporangium melleum]GII73806.1 hypothetical protein Sme01_62820 [Sphaerisporangium melleum]
MILPEPKDTDVVQLAALSAVGWAEGLSFRQEDGDYITVMLLAAGLARIRDDRRRMDAGEYLTRTSADQGLLPVPWRSGMTRLWWRFRTAGEIPPQNDLKLFELCRKPFSEWPIRLRLSVADIEQSLLDGDELTPMAEQAARLSVRDVEAELIENLVFRELMLVAELNARDEAEVQTHYCELRRLLIDNPILSEAQVRRLTGRFPKCGGNGQPVLQRFIQAAYVHRAAPGRVKIAVCDRCGNPTQQGVDGCGTVGCSGHPADLVIESVGGYYVQHRATRRFFHDPGLVEARVLDRLAEISTEGTIRVEEWPGLDAYDIRVSFLSGLDVIEVWGADAKDQVSPGLLGLGFSWRPDPPCDRRFLVLPKHRADQPGYVADLTAELQGRASDVSVVSEDAFVASVVARAEEVTGR